VRVLRVRRRRQGQEGAGVGLPAAAAVHRHGAGPVIAVLQPVVTVDPEQQARAIAWQNRKDYWLKSHRDPEIAAKGTKGDRVALKVLTAAGVGLLAYESYRNYVHAFGDPFDKRESNVFNVTNTHAAHKDKFKGFRLENLSHDGVDLPKGSIVKRISQTRESEPRKQGFYCVFDDEDVKRYKAVMPVYFKSPFFQLGGPPKDARNTVVHIKAKNGVRAPSPRETHFLYERTLKSFPEHDSKRRRWERGDDDTRAKMLSEFGEDMSSGYNPHFARYKELAIKDGYNATIDFNDLGRLGRRPLKVFDGEEFEIDHHEDLDDKEVSALQRTIRRAAMHSDLGGINFAEQLLPSVGSLNHAGVKGMRWGVRKSEDSSSSGSAEGSRNPFRRKGPEATVEVKKDKKGNTEVIKTTMRPGDTGRGGMEVGYGDAASGMSRIDGQYGAYGEPAKKKAFSGATGLEIATVAVLGAVAYNTYRKNIHKANPLYHIPGLRHHVDPNYHRNQYIKSLNLTGKPPRGGYINGVPARGMPHPHFPAAPPAPAITQLQQQHPHIVPQQVTPVVHQPAPVFHSPVHHHYPPPQGASHPNHSPTLNPSYAGVTPKTPKSVQKQQAKVTKNLNKQLTKTQQNAVQKATTMTHPPGTSPGAFIAYLNPSKDPAKRHAQAMDLIRDAQARRAAAEQEHKAAGRKGPVDYKKYDIPGSQAALQDAWDFIQKRRQGAQARSFTIDTILRQSAADDASNDAGIAKHKAILKADGKISLEDYLFGVKDAQEETFGKKGILRETSFMRPGLTLPKGTLFSRCSVKPEKGFDGGTYCVVGKEDFDRLVVSFNDTVPEGDRYLIFWSIKSEIKVPDLQTAVEYYWDAMSTVSPKEVTFDDAIAAYATRAGAPWLMEQPVTKLFFENLAKDGYGAIVDELTSGVTTEYPLIFFMHSVATETASMPLSDEQIKASQSDLVAIRGWQLSKNTLSSLTGVQLGADALAEPAKPIAQSAIDILNSVGNRPSSSESLQHLSERGKDYIYSG
jgi:hypothetical protein